MGFLKTITITIIFAFVSKFMYFWLVGNGYGVHFYNVLPGPCRVVPGIECGSEKISVTRDGLAFITNGLKLLTNCNKKYLRGNIYLFDFNHPEKNVTKLVIQGEAIDLKTFEPLGMDVYEDFTKGTIKLYVINHGGDAVEVFQYDKNNPVLKHLETITDNKFHCLDDITIIDENRFYLTNFQQYCHSSYFFIKASEFFLQMKTAAIVYYDHTKSTVVADGESFLNGITLSKDKSQIFSVSTSTGQLLVYDRNENSGRLHLRKKLFIGHHPDNIFTDIFTGHLYVGTQKEPFAHVAVSLNKTEYCSASGIKLKAKSEKWDDVDIEEVFHHDGKNFVHGVSSVAYYKGHYLFGTVFHKLAYCKERN